jgi:hypothetical protein
MAKLSLAADFPRGDLYFRGSFRHKARESLRNVCVNQESNIEPGEKYEDIAHPNCGNPVELPVLERPRAILGAKRSESGQLP